MQLNEAVSRRLVELMQERGMTQYQLYMKSGVPKSTIGNLVNCAYNSLFNFFLHDLSRSFPSICRENAGTLRRNHQPVQKMLIHFYAPVP